MGKWYLCIICLTLMGNMAKGQYYRQDRGWMLGVNAGYCYPTGDMGKILKNGWGGNLSAKYLINEVIGIGFEGGYYAFKSKIAQEGTGGTSQDYKAHLIPALLEATFYIPTWNRTTLPYLGIQFGGYVTHIKVSYKEDYPLTNYSKKLFLFSPGAGVHAGVLCQLASNRLWLDLKLRADYVPKIEDEYNFGEDDLTSRNIGFNKMLNIGGNIGLLYKF
ncbi:MAG: outer membrane beta-barrel protein [Odoribacter sp.]